MEKKCKVKNCNNKCHANNYCHKHFSQWYKYGKILKRTMFDKNEIINCDNYYEICLYSGRGEQKEVARTKIDKEDLEKVKNYKWGSDCHGYARNVKNKLFLHHLILGRKKEYDIDHKNHDILDNRKQNLRFTTHSQNIMNQRLRSNNLSGYPGIIWHKKAKKWMADIMINYKKIYLGLFETKQDAINIRKQAEIKYFGEFRYKD
jgi:hypothetical protein